MPTSSQAIDELLEVIDSGDRASPKLPQHVADAMIQWQDHQERSLAILRCSLADFPDYFRATRAAFIDGDLVALKKAMRFAYQTRGAVRNIDWVRLMARDLPNIAPPTLAREAAMMGLCATGIFYLEQMDKTLSRPARSVMDGATYARLDGFWQEACDRGSLPFRLAAALTEEEYEAICAQRRDVFHDPFA